MARIETTSPDFNGGIKRLWDQLSKAFNGNVSYGDGTNSDNIAGVWVNALSVAGNFTVTHNLGKVPVGWHMVNTDAFENLRFVSSTKTQLTLVGQNGGANLKLFVF